MTIRTLLNRLLQWRQPRTCATCDHSDARGTLCYEALGHGYGQPVDADGCCEKWSKRKG